MSWRIFWYQRPSDGSTAPDTAISLKNQMFQTEQEAKSFCVILLEEGSRGISVNVPASARLLKGNELRAWLGSEGA